MNLLNFQDWQIIALTETKSYFFIRAKYHQLRASQPRCNNCFQGISFTQKYGIRLRTFKDAPMRGKAVSGLLAVQRYKCLVCDSVFQDNVPELEENSRFTKRLTYYVEEQSIKKSFLSVACEAGISEAAVRSIFECFMDRNNETLVGGTPTVLGIDDVYIGGVPRCILTDIQRKEVVDILPRRDMSTVYEYLSQMKNKSRVRIIAMDMSKPFFDCVSDAFPHAQIVIDTFHVQRMINQAVNGFLRNLRSKFGLSQRRIYLRDRFLLMKRGYSLSTEEKLILNNWRRQLPPLDDVYKLKEEFLALWRLSDRGPAEEAYRQWEQRIPQESLFVFENILVTIKNWHNEIFNYFDNRITNAFTESSNNLVKHIQREARGSSFKVIRAKMLFRKFYK